MFYYERGLVTSLNAQANAQVDNEYSKDDIMLKGIVIRKTRLHLPYHDHGTKTWFSLG